jgi:CheY-like chemotaxis protein
MEVRSMVLRNAGYIVEEAYSLRDALSLIPSDTVDLVLVCHSVPASEQDKLIYAVRKQRKLMPVLCITAYDGGAQGKCVNVENSPHALIDAVHLAAQASMGTPKYRTH